MCVRSLRGHLHSQRARSAHRYRSICCLNDKRTMNQKPMKGVAIVMMTLVTSVSHLHAEAPTTPKAAEFRDAKHDILSAPEPVYPFEARAHGIRGTGIFDLRVRRDGTVAAVVVVRSTQDVQLDRAATEALMQWRFKANLYTSVKVPLEFRHSRAQIVTPLLGPRRQTTR